MKASDFVRTYKASALVAEAQTGLSWRISLSQAALESGWGEHAPGNNFFGVKDSDGLNGNEQLLTTTEYAKSNRLKFPKIFSIRWDSAKKLWKYKVRDWFRKYPDCSETFIEHANFFKSRSRYATAWKYRHDPDAFFDEIAKAGYATDPHYAKLLKSICKTITTL